MESTQNDTKLSEDQTRNENLRVQKTEYIKQQLIRKREAEDARMSRLMQEQEVIDVLRESIDETKWETEELRKYNREFQEQVNAQVYEANGISADKLTGMREYKNAVFRGVAVITFLFSAALTILCGVLHGFRSEIALLMAAYTAMEGALLSQEKKQIPALFIVCRVLFILALPAMAVMFVCYEQQLPLYELLFPYATILAVIFSALGVLSYFLHDPYREDRKILRAARKQIRKIEKMAEADIRKAQKAQKKEAETASAALPEETPAPEPVAVLPEEAPAPEPIVLTLTPEETETVAAVE